MPTFAFTPSTTRPIVTPESIDKALQTIIAPTLLADYKNYSSYKFTTEFVQMQAIFSEHRPWFNALCDSPTRKFHPVIIKLLTPNHTHHPDRPPLHHYVTDWRLVLLEFPHISEVDPTMLAYVQSDEKGTREIYTRTTIGKFIKRHCPTMPDHELRDFVALHSDSLHDDADPNDPDTYDPSKSKTMSLVHSTAQMIQAVQTGPKTCMKDSGWDDDPDTHPYRAYAPKYGWHMAVRRSKTNGSTVMGRCLCLTHGENKLFVRSFMRNVDDPVNGYSNSDTQLEAWLKAQGYHRMKQWPQGAKLDAIHTDNTDEYLMPYLDGNCQRVDFHGEHFTIDETGALDADKTEGTVNINDEADMESCDHCGDSTDSDDLYGVGDSGDCRVCGHCMENHYTYVVGRRGHEYYVSCENSVYVQSRDEYYDVDYLDDNEVVWCDDENEYLALDEVWACAATGTIYSHRTDYVEIDGDWYHPDDAPKVETEETTETTTTN